MVGLSRTHLTLKALIAIIFCLIGLQYLSLLQVNEKQRRPGNSRSLFFFERKNDNGGHNGLLESISDLLEPTKVLPDNVLSEMSTSTTNSPILTTISNHSNAKALPTCPMIPPGNDKKNSLYFRYFQNVFKK